MPRKVKLKKRSSAVSDTPKWRRDVPTLFNSVCQYADWLDAICIACPPAEQIVERQLCELQKSIYLARLDGYIEAIEAFTGIHYNFTRTDDYYGICDDDEDFIYKVPRCLK